MDVLTTVFSTRELAAGVWLTIVALWALSVPSIRKSLVGILKSLCAPIFLKLGCLLVAYVAGVVWVGHSIGFWDVFLLKDTIYWLLFSGIVISGRSLSGPGDEGFLRNYATDYVKIIVVLEALVAAHTFSLLVELILLPLVTMIALIQAAAGTRDEYRPFARAADVALAIVGLLVIASAASRVLEDPGGLLDGVLMRRALLPLALSIAFLPAAFGLALYSAYETLFVRLRIGPVKEASFKRFAKWRLFRHLGWKLSNVRRFSRRWAGPLMRVRSESELNALLAADVKGLRGESSGTGGSRTPNVG